jgi:UPF0042 nucleotide-binding protein
MSGPAANARFVVITGPAGAGKSTALKTFEDLGFYAVDNLPVELLPSFVHLPLGKPGDPFRAALVMDLRTPRFAEGFPRIYRDLASRGYNLELLFLEADDEALLRRFSQTRRQHPLARPGETVAEGIARERGLLEPIKAQASQVLDTSRFTIHELRRELTRLFSQEAGPAPLQVNLMSFGYKYGLPREADLVMDVRFLANPYFVNGLQELDGCDPRVVDYVLQGEVAAAFLRKFKDLLEFLIPLYHREGKSQLTVAIGCTGGRHRSVVVAEWLARSLRSPHYRLTLRHRDKDLES